jgi:hypothetical protein
MDASLQPRIEQLAKDFAIPHDERVPELNSMPPKS